jgi:hypothetical protein
MLCPPSPIPSSAWASLPILAARLFSPNMLSWSSIRMATASSMDGTDKMAHASGASLSRPPCQSCRNFHLETHAFPDACIWRRMLRSRAHAEALPIPNILPPARRKPPSQSYQNLHLETHAFPDAFVWRRMLRSRVHAEALPILNVLPPAHCKPPSQACWCPHCLKNMRNRAHMEALPIFLSRLLLTQFSTPLHFPCLPQPLRSQQLLLHNPIPLRGAWPSTRRATPAQSHTCMERPKPWR